MIQAGQTTIARCQTWLSPVHGNRDEGGHDAIWCSLVNVGTGAVTHNAGGAWTPWALMAHGFMDDFGSLVLVDGGFK